MHYLIVDTGTEIFCHLKISSQMPSLSQNLPLAEPVRHIIKHFCGHRKAVIQNGSTNL